MEENVGLTCLYKNGESKNFTSDQVEAAEKDGWKDEPQPVTQAAAKEFPTAQTSEVKNLQ